MVRIHSRQQKSLTIKTGKIMKTILKFKKIIAELREETQLDYMFKQLLLGTVIGVVLIALIGACSAIGDYLEVAL
jgi:hypothetical protein